MPTASSAPRTHSRECCPLQYRGPHTCSPWDVRRPARLCWVTVSCEIGSLAALCTRRTRAAMHIRGWCQRHCALPAAASSRPLWAGSRHATSDLLVSERAPIWPRRSFYFHGSYPQCWQIVVVSLVNIKRGSGRSFRNVPRRSVFG